MTPHPQPPDPSTSVETLPPASETTDPPPPFDSSDHEPTFCNYLMLILFGGLCILIIALSPSPLYTLSFAILAVLPAFIVARFIRRNFADDAVTSPFLLKQFIYGAVPLIILASMVESMFTALFAVLLFGSDAGRFIQQFTNGFGNETTTTTNRTIALTSHLPSPISPTFLNPTQTLLSITTTSRQTPDLSNTSVTGTFPLWKIILFCIITAFLIAGLVEEVGKWLVARRYRKVNFHIQNYCEQRTISCRGIIAVVCMGALGFATTENVGFIIGIAVVPAKGFPFRIIAVTLLRGVLAFPVHVGAQFYVAVAAANTYIFQEVNRIMYALFVAVMFHGIFDAVSLVFASLISLEKLPEWTIAIVIAFQLCLVLVLVVLCRARYKALLERERIVLSSAPV